MEAKPTPSPVYLLTQGTARRLPIADSSIHCIVLSIPYYQKRLYDVEPEVWGGHPDCDHDWHPAPKAPFKHSPASFYCSDCTAWYGRWGNEPTVEQYVINTVIVTREFYRVLHPSGQLFLNVDDTRHPKERVWLRVPERLYNALADDGWRAEGRITWHVTNKLPHNTPQFTHTFEMIYQLNKSKQAYFDGEANRIGGKWNGRLRNVWPIANAKIKKKNGRKNSASYPLDIPLRIIKAATSEAGVCPHCLWPWQRQQAVEVGELIDRNVKPVHDDGFGGLNGAGKTTLNRQVNRTTLGWRQSCHCPVHNPIPATVLDPCVGTGPTMEAAVELCRSCFGADLSHTYLTEEAAPNLAEVLAIPVHPKPEAFHPQTAVSGQITMFQGVTS